MILDNDMQRWCSDKGDKNYYKILLVDKEHYPTNVAYVYTIYCYPYTFTNNLVRPIKFEK